MLEIDLSGLKINQLRLLHSKKFRGLRFVKARNLHDDNGDLTSERNVISEYLLETCEMDYTYYMILRGISFGFIGVLAICVIFSVTQLVVTIPVFVISILSYILSTRRKTNFILGEVGVDMVESFYNEKIKEKFNL